jgi:HEAT repeat protein
MKRVPLAFGALGLVAVGVIIWLCLPPSSPTIEDRSLEDWVREIEIEGMPQHQHAYEVLIAVGPKIVPDLSRLLRRTDFSLLTRLPAAWIPSRVTLSANESLRLKANAAWIISVIAYRNPNNPETTRAVPCLITTLSSRSQEVRSVSAQALAAIGLGASNAIHVLIPSTMDQSPSVRLSAVEALGRIGLRSPESLRALQASLLDKSWDVRFVATQALERLEREAQ